MKQEQFIEIVKWQKETFGEATPLSKVKHLIKEVKELEDGLINGGDDNIRQEYADCFLLLFGSAAAYGFSYEQINIIIDEKMKINRRRTWGKPDKDGVVSHIKS